MSSRHNDCYITIEKIIRIVENQCQEFEILGSTLSETYKRYRTKKKVDVTKARGYETGYDKCYV